MITVVCIPAYNEGNNISKIVKESKKYADHVIVCDDGSVDETYKNALDSGAIVIKHTKNTGKGESLKTLFEESKKHNADYIITIDGDGQFLPSEIPKLFKKIQATNSDIVIGYRFDDETDMPTYRKIGNKLFDKVTNLATDLPFRDTQSGFRVYSKNAIEKIHFTTSGFGADSEILIDACKKSLKISEEKITVIYDTGGKTSSKNPVSHSSDVLGSLLESIAITHPIKYVGIPGVVFLIIGIIYSIVVITIFNDIRYFSIPSTLVALGSLVTGLMLILMSIVLFAISRAFLKISKN
jgi:glycosyltransferase involved in cell wall biosynthesis